MCLIKRSICGRAAQRDREGEEGSRRRGVRAQVARRAPDAGVAVTSRRRRHKKVKWY